MKHMYRLILTSTIAVVVGLAAGCSSEKSSQEPVAEDAPLTLRDSIEIVLNDALARLRYHDKSGLFDNEFSYVRDTTTFDDYLKTGQMIYSLEEDTVVKVDVDSIGFVDSDSAVVLVSVRTKNSKAEENEFEAVLTVYHHKGRWIKPTIGAIQHQLEYEDYRRRVDSAASAEAG